MIKIRAASAARTAFGARCLSIKIVTDMDHEIGFLTSG
jgi:hypothetical protein